MSGSVGSGLPVTYRFGPYLLDTARRQLWVGGTPKPLTEKLFQILVLLLEANRQVVPKQDFFSAVWPNEQPSDANLTTHIYVLRQILGEKGNDRSVIVTVSGQGYRLAVPSEVKVGLGMKGLCERCAAVLAPDGIAFICSYECTYCLDCASMFSHCPHCVGELVRRPRRLPIAGVDEN